MQSPVQPPRMSDRGDSFQGPERMSSRVMTQQKRVQTIDTQNTGALPAASPARTSSLRQLPVGVRATGVSQHDPMPLRSPRSNNSMSSLHQPSLPATSPIIQSAVQPTGSSMIPQVRRLSQQAVKMDSSDFRYSPALSLKSEHSHEGSHGTLGDGSENPKRSTVVSAGARLSALGSPSPAQSDAASVHSSIPEREPLSVANPVHSREPPASSASPSSASPTSNGSLPPPPRKSTDKFEAPALVPTVNLHQGSPRSWRSSPEHSPESISPVETLSTNRVSVSDTLPFSSLASEDPMMELPLSQFDQTQHDDNRFNQQNLGVSQQEHDKPASSIATGSEYEESFDAMQYHLYEGAGTNSLPTSMRSRMSREIGPSSRPASSLSRDDANGYRQKSIFAPAAGSPYPQEGSDTFDMHPHLRSGSDHAQAPPEMNPLTKRPRYSHLFLQTTIFSGYLNKQSRHSSFQKRLFRCDGILLVCLSIKSIPLPYQADISTCRTEDFYREDDNFLKTVKRYYPTDPPLPVIPNMLLADPDADGIPQEDSRNFYVPKWIIATSSILSVRSLVPHPHPMPQTKKARTFIIRTRARDYTLCAPTAEEFRRWTFLLSRLCVGNESIRESSSFEDFDDDIDYPDSFGGNARGHPARFMEKADTWKQCVRELMAKDPSTHRSLTNVGGSVAVALPTPGNTPDGTPRRRSSIAASSVTQKSFATQKTGMNRAEADYEYQQQFDEYEEAKARTVQAHKSQHRFDIAQTGVEPQPPQHAIRKDSPGRSTLTETHTDSTLMAEYYAANPVDSVPTLTEIERELMDLRRVPAAESIPPHIAQSARAAVYHPGQNTSITATQMSRASAPKAEMSLPTDLASILRIIAHLRGEYTGSPDDDNQQQSTPLFPQRQFAVHFVSKSIPILLSKVQHMLPRYPTCMDVADDWDEIVDTWNPSSVDLRGQDPMIKDLERLVGHMLVLLG
ncbi:hypothetical protein DFJ77DRAFT_265846 [Powellomyces hirtus]|nr:hypothetical protein DFJ77DRAFT_265846 [Powellomyces hirtus]